MIRVASITQTRDENTIISHQLDVLSLLCDKIIIVDDSSNDSTLNRIKYHKNNKNICVIRNTEKRRNEGNLFNIAMKKAKLLGCERIYIADADEIMSPQSIEKANKLLRETYKNIRVHRAEICLDQETYYGVEGTGKLIFVNSNARFGTNKVIHQSQPNMKNQTLIDPEECCLLHYGTCDYAFQIFKCMSYIIWENKTENKSIDQGYHEYFKQYKNFVFSTGKSISKYVWSGEYGIESPFPYSHYMDRDARDICSAVDVEKGFDVFKLASELKDNKFAREYIYGRV